MTYTDPNFVPEKPSVQYYLHEYTYPELLEIARPVIDWTGTLWAGPNRKGMNAPNPVDLWKAWQRDTARADYKLIPQHVMDYYQQTKGFSRPPKNGELDLNKQPIVVTSPKFTWSPSKIMQFETCPYQYAAQYFYKTLPYQETEATIWGTRVHAAAEDFMNGKEITDFDAFALVEKWVKTLSKVPGERFVEHKIGVNTKGIPCDYDSAEGRMILDFGVKWDDKMLLVDYKTGKQKADDTQLKIYALFMAMAHPEVKTITYKYVWLKDNVATGGELTRADLPKIGQELSLKIKRMREAWDNEVFAQKPSGLCKRFCGCVECPHCGGGR